GERDGPCAVECGGAGCRIRGKCGNEIIGAHIRTCPLFYENAPISSFRCPGIDPGPMRQQTRGDSWTPAQGRGSEERQSEFFENATFLCLSEAGGDGGETAVEGYADGGFLHAEALRGFADRGAFEADGRDDLFLAVREAIESALDVAGVGFFLFGGGEGFGKIADIDLDPLAVAAIG